MIAITHKFTSLVGLTLSVSGCVSSPRFVKDLAAAPIATGHLRAETVACGRKAVGLNACFFEDGVVEGELWVRKITSGTITVDPGECGSERSFRYDESGGRWMKIPLGEIIGKSITRDCVATVYESFESQGQRFQFPLQGLKARVLLSPCAHGFKCEFSSEQLSEVDEASLWRITNAKSGVFMLRGGGESWIEPTNFHGPVTVSVNSYLPILKPAETQLFIAGVIEDTGTRLKTIRAVSKYSAGDLPVSIPSVDERAGQTRVRGDESVLFIELDDQGVNASREVVFRPAVEPSVNTVRLYTSQGRTLILDVKGGHVTWTQ